MACNVGGIERPIRIVFGLLLIGVGVFGELTGAVLGVVLALGAIALVTGIIGFCPAWTLLGINTCPMQSSGKKS